MFYVEHDEKKLLNVNTCILFYNTLNIKGVKQANKFSLQVEYLDLYLNSSKLSSKKESIDI